VLAIVREASPIVCALLIAGAGGSAICADLGSRKIRDEIDAMEAADVRAMFMAFAAGLIGDFDRYLERGAPDLIRDGVGFGIEGLWLDDAEFTDMMRDLYRVLDSRRANQPGKGRRRRLLASVLLPGDDTARKGTT